MNEETLRALIMVNPFMSAAYKLGCQDGADSAYDNGYELGYDAGLIDGEMESNAG